jgi:Protein of unknown function (DUF2934)
MTPNRHADIERCAYLFWEREGRPDGKALEHWLRAEREVEAQGNSQVAGPTEPMRPTSQAKRSAKRRDRTPR